MARSQTLICHPLTRHRPTHHALTRHRPTHHALTHRRGEGS